MTPKNTKTPRTFENEKSLKSLECLEYLMQVRVTVRVGDVGGTVFLDFYRLLLCRAKEVLVNDRHSLQGAIIVLAQATDEIPRQTVLRLIPEGRDRVTLMRQGRLNQLIS